MGTAPVEMYKLFFGSQARCPDLSEDAGLSCNRPDAQVSSPVFGHTVIFVVKLPLKELSFGQEWTAKAKLIRCPAPLPETALDPVLTRMLEIVLSAEGKEGNQGATASAKEDVRKGRIENPPDQGKKRTASEDPEGMASKRGKKSSPEDPAPENALAALRPQGDQLSSEP